jgi:hypothetical protein
MAVDNPRVRARAELEELGMSAESAAYLVDDRPSGGWDTLVTKDQLRAEMAELRAEMAEFRAELQRELRAQTWRLTMALLATVTLMTAILRLA